MSSDLALLQRGIITCNYLSFCPLRNLASLLIHQLNLSFSQLWNLASLLISQLNRRTVIVHCLYFTTNFYTISHTILNMVKTLSLYLGTICFLYASSLTDFLLSVLAPPPVPLAIRYWSLVQKPRLPTSGLAQGGVQTRRKDLFAVEQGYHLAREEVDLSIVFYIKPDLYPKV